MENNTILVSHSKVKNMKVKELIINHSIVDNILNTVILTEEAQLEALDALIERNPNWLELKIETQKALIYKEMKEVTILTYLNANNYLPNVDSCSVAVNEDGDYYITAFSYENTKEQEILEEEIINEQRKK